jgi:ferric-dicitrate binding protein FerR (iron transport regulator)
MTAGGRDLPLRFSDGSTVLLEPRSGARVRRLDGDGAEVVLDRGVARVHVVPRAGNRWVLRAGPFAVRVVGTRFRLAWDPIVEVLNLELRKGKVIVEGPLVGQRTVETGQRLRVSLEARRVEWPHRSQASAKRPVAGVSASARSAAPAQPMPAEASPAAKLSPGARSRPAAERRPTAQQRATSQVGASRRQSSRRPGPTSPWALARAGRFEQAMTAADRLGWPRIIEKATAEQLNTLADAARLARRPGRAEQINQRLRQRFAGTIESAIAAFSLGRLAFEQRAFARAARWFERYLAEQPHGGLAREAAGRIVEALHRAGERGRALGAARHYLQQYPKGPHADFARRVVEAQRGPR